MTTSLVLKYEWTLGERIGDAAGFGTVYAASSPDYPNAVAKLVPKAPGAERELLLADNLEGVRNVVPVIDSGETDDAWVLVMPRAEKSLLAHLSEVQGPLGLADTVVVLTDLATALSDLEGHVVHRDLKPANVLLLDGRWCLADFGISRYAEATTAPETRKLAWTPQYAAPEQWRAERATSATDIYALGVIAYELLTGVRPFTGPAAHDYRQQHLHGTPPPLEGVPNSIAALVDECLLKAPEARPSASNVLARLAGLPHSAPSGGLARLQAVNRAEVARRAEEARQASLSRSEEERRGALVDAATKGLARITDALRDAILEAAPSVSLREGIPNGGWKLEFGEAELRFAGLAETPSTPWIGPQGPVFDVVAHTSIGIRIRRPRNYGGRGHSLWYCDAQEAGRYQWFETAFMNSPLLSSDSEVDPFALDPGADAAVALGRAIGTKQAAWPFTPIMADGLDKFISRWAEWFAAAAEGKLRHPSNMPEISPQGSWRS